MLSIGQLPLTSNLPHDWFDYVFTLSQPVNMFWHKEALSSDQLSWKLRIEQPMPSNTPQLNSMSCFLPLPATVPFHRVSATILQIFARFYLLKTFCTTSNKHYHQHDKLEQACTGTCWHALASGHRRTAPAIDLIHASLANLRSTLATRTSFTRTPNPVQTRLGITQWDDWVADGVTLGSYMNEHLPWSR